MIPGAKPNSNGTIDTRTDERNEKREIIVGSGGKLYNPGHLPDLGNVNALFF